MEATVHWLRHTGISIEKNIAYQESWLSRSCVVYLNFLYTQNRKK